MMIDKLRQLAKDRKAFLKESMSGDKHCILFYDYTWNFEYEVKHESCDMAALQILNALKETLQHRTDYHSKVIKGMSESLEFINDAVKVSVMG